MAFADWVPSFIKVEWCVQGAACVPGCYARKAARYTNLGYTSDGFTEMEKIKFFIVHVV